MNGGPSHVDTFDPKPALETRGQPPSAPFIGRRRRFHAIAVRVQPHGARAASS